MASLLIVGLFFGLGYWLGAANAKTDALEQQSAELLNRLAAILNTPQADHEQGEGNA
jgi:hypothetical protein